MELSLLVKSSWQIAQLGDQDSGSEFIYLL